MLINLAGRWLKGLSESDRRLDLIPIKPPYPFAHSGHHLFYTSYVFRRWLFFCAFFRMQPSLWCWESNLPSPWGSVRVVRLKRVLVGCKVGYDFSYWPGSQGCRILVQYSRKPPLFHLLELHSISHRFNTMPVHLTTVLICGWEVWRTPIACGITRSRSIVMQSPN